MAAASIGSNLAFTPTTAQTFALFVGLLILHATLCSLNPTVVARLQIPFIIINFALCLVLIIGVPVATPKELKNGAAYAFGDFQNFHISEEALNADVAIPYAIILACTSSGILGWGTIMCVAINVALAFSMGHDLEGIIDSPIGQPMATILFNSFGVRGTLAVWAWIIIVQFEMGVSMLTTASRQIFAFSRDGALPLSGFLYNINSRTHAPILAVWFVATTSSILGLLAFAGPTAINAIFSLVVAGQYFAYSVPITARFVGHKEPKRGPFSLGRWSKYVAATAVAWMAFIVVVFFFPSQPAPNSTNMNYTVVVLGGTLLLATIYYFFPVYGGRYWFKGPVQTIEDIDAVSQDTHSD
ncbi:hypothetical protein C0995_009887 [Termitomyces sp. Mi166|nr:hypothetical protein C0995_009887 [Termitomyces sp. Mi166\